MMLMMKTKLTRRRIPDRHSWRGVTEIKVFWEATPPWWNILGHQAVSTLGKLVDAMKCRNMQNCRNLNSIEGPYPSVNTLCNQRPIWGKLFCTFRGEYWWSFEKFWSKLWEIVAIFQLCVWDGGWVWDTWGEAADKREICCLPCPLSWGMEPPKRYHGDDEDALHKVGKRRKRVVLKVWEYKL